MDIGNSRLKWGIFSRGKLDHWDAVPIDSFQLTDSLSQALDAVIFSSTITHFSEIVAPFDGLPIYELTHKFKCPIISEYTTPETIGTDRIAAYHGAWSLFPDSNLLVVDAGSCITFDLVTTDGVHKGGMISPGIQMRLRAMHEFTSRLPSAPIPENFGPIARSTLDAIGQGALCGSVYEIEGIIGYLKDKLGKLKVVLTGGDSKLFEKRIKTEIFAEQNLVLIGLYEIFKNHVQHLD